MNNTSILIVEDDAEMRETLCDILVDEGYKVKTAGTGKRALALAKKETFPICLVDLKLPDITGLEVVKGLKSINVDTAPIIITAFASKETAIEALKAGASCYIEKPMNLEELLSTVKRTSDAYQLLEAKRSAETALQKNEERYRTLVESTEDSVYLVDKTCRYLFMNEKHLSRLRLSSDHYLGRPYRAFHSDDAAKLFAEKVKHVFKSGASIQHEYENSEGQYFIKTLSPVKTHKTGRVRAVTVVSKDITGRKAAEERIEHLNSVHKAIMNVDQLILVEKDRDRLLQKACNALIDARNYDAAWIGLLKDGERFTTLKGSCLMDDVARFCKHLKAGDFPPCIKNALAQKDPLIVQDKTIDNEDCIFKDSCAGTKTVLIRAEHANRLFGLLAISVTAGVTISEEEKELLTEVAGNIAFALHNMELEEERKCANELLAESEKQLRETEAYLNNVIASSADAIVVVDMDGIVRDWNKGAEDYMGYTTDDVVGRSNKRFYTESEEAERIMETVLKEGMLKNYRTTVLNKNKCLFPYLLIYNILQHINNLELMKCNKNQ